MNVFRNAELLKNRGFNDKTTIILKPFNKYTVRAPDGFECDFSSIKCKLCDLFDNTYIKYDLEKEDTYGCVNTIVSRNIVIVEYFNSYNKGD